MFESSKNPTMKNFILFTLTLAASTCFSQSWQPLSDAPIGRHHPISFSLNGKGYAITGTTSNGQPSQDAFEYDPTADSWTTLSPFPGPARSFGIGTVTNGIAYLGFGASLSSYLNDFWSYDASTNTWTQLASCDCSGRRHPAMIAVGNKIYVGLGDDATGDRADWWMYDIDLNTWTQIANLPGPSRHHPYMFSVQGEAFAGLGHSGNVIYNDWYKLDTLTNSWTRMNDFPGEGRVAGTQFSIDTKGFVLSGDGDNHSFMSTGEMWRYSADVDTWKQLTPHPGISLWAPGSFVIDNEVYFFGGQNRISLQLPTNVWKFDLTSEVLSVNENNIANQITFPNPANNTVNWEYNSAISNLEVYNAVGQLVVKQNVNSHSFNTSALQNGLYFIHFYDQHTRLSTAKVLIQH